MQQLLRCQVWFYRAWRQARKQACNQQRQRSWECRNGLGTESGATGRGGKGVGKGGTSADYGTGGCRNAPGIAGYISKPGLKPGACSSLDNDVRERRNGPGVELAATGRSSNQVRKAASSCRSADESSAGCSIGHEPGTAELDEKQGIPVGSKADIGSSTADGLEVRSSNVCTGLARLADTLNTAD